MAGPRAGPGRLLAAMVMARRRRWLVVFGALFAATLVIALIFAITDRESESPPQLPELEGELRKRGLGIEVSWPASWELAERRQPIRLRGPDGELEILISAPARTGNAEDALEAELEAVDERFQVRGAMAPSSRRIGGLRGIEVVVSALQEDGRPVRILVATADGERRTYVVEVVSAEGVSEARLVEAQLILNSLELSK